MTSTPPDTSREPYRGQPVSFIRRSNRMGDRQQRAWDQLHARFVIDVPRAEHSTSVHPEFRFDAAQSFGRAAPLVVEVGIGMGDALVNAAHDHPGTDFLAIDVHRPGLAQTLLQMRSRELTNIRLVQANAVVVLSTMIEATTVDELWAFFPDPWHKSRHHKRRLVTPSFASTAARVLRPGGMLRLATDWEPYAEQMREVFDAALEFDRSWELAGEPWAPRFDGRLLTRFEKKGITRGRQIRDLAYVRRPVP